MFIFTFSEKVFQRGRTFEKQQKLDLKKRKMKWEPNGEETVMEEEKVSNE